MPAWILGLGSAFGAVLVKMATQLVTEAFLKRAIITGLQSIANKTETEVDNQLLSAAREAWGANED